MSLQYLHPSPGVTVTNTPEGRAAYERNWEYINAAGKRYPVVIGPSGVQLYDQREYGLEQGNLL
jgi:hypothetical protein